MGITRLILSYWKDVKLLANANTIVLKLFEKFLQLT